MDPIDPWITVGSARRKKTIELSEKTVSPTLMACLFIDLTVSAVGRRQGGDCCGGDRGCVGKAEIHRESMKAAGRQLRIRKLPKGQEYVEMSVLRELLGASEASIRRDLIALETSGVLKRVFGGAM